MYEEVSRINDGVSKGWLVNSSRDGEALEILFSDWECGGKDNALGAARLFSGSLYMLMSGG